MAGGIEGGGKRGFEFYRAGEAESVEAQPYVDRGAAADGHEATPMADDHPGTDEADMAKAIAAKTGGGGQLLGGMKPGGAKGFEEITTGAEKGFDSHLKPGGEKAITETGKPGGERAALNAAPKAGSDAEARLSKEPCYTQAKGGTKEGVGPFSRGGVKGGETRGMDHDGKTQLKPEQQIQKLQQMLDAGDEEGATKLANEVLHNRSLPANFRTQVERMLGGVG